ncbi:MAG: multicopper oxidase domain-containing protein [Deltaproteobacteria bacterium]|nr:multicopper oxidase domain-containing protein [Deltaproteobacteria bacterium]
MGMNRRQFLKAGIVGGAGWVAWQGGFVTPKGHAYQVSRGLRKFIQPLPLFGTNIPLAAADNVTYGAGVDYYEIQATVFRQRLHPNLPAAGTRLYGYQQLNGAAGPGPAQTLGGAVLATKGKPVRIKFNSNLPASHILPYDPTIPSPGNGGNLQDRAAIHLHGGLVPWTSDGGPFHWQSNPLNSGTTLWGASVVPWLPDMNGVPTWDYYYPNAQSARLMWYHDHAVGITRTNAYAGIATGYILTDPVEAGLAASNKIPLLGQPLVFQDKVFWDPALDPGYPVPGAVAGDLWYPWQYDPAIWLVNPGGLPLPPVSAIPEMFGDTMLVNGAVYPAHSITQDRVRFRLLNACNARFLNLSFVYDNGLGEPLGGLFGAAIPAPVNVWLLGTEGGLLPQPVQLFANGRATFVNAMFVGPAERFDIIVDFSRCRGARVLLYNDAPGPYPAGAPIFDFFWRPTRANPNPNAPRLPGFGPNTRTIMRFDVARTLAATGMTVPAAIAQDMPVTVVPAGGGALPAFPAPLPPLTVPTPPLPYGFYNPANPRFITLNEEFDAYGRLMQTVGTNVAVGTDAAGTPIFGRPYPQGTGSEPTEMVQYGTSEVWSLINLSADTHPMHVHLFNVRVLGRLPIDPLAFIASGGGDPRNFAIGLERGPERNELGWKETVKAHPGEVTTVLVAVEHPLPGGLRTVDVTSSVTGLTYQGTLPQSPRLAAMGTQYAGDEYVWHCHILEHEEHDMMRPLVGNP